MYRNGSISQSRDIFGGNGEAAGRFGGNGAAEQWPSKESTGDGATRSFLEVLCVSNGDVFVFQVQFRPQTRRHKLANCEAVHVDPVHLRRDPG
jgi:hypothetical protein